MILNSMLHNSPAVAVVAPLLALAAYGVASVFGALARRVRRGRSPLH